MIDIHSHILPGLDDGAKDIGTAIEMAEIYMDNGFRHVIATPHWIDDIRSNIVPKTRALVDLMNNELTRKGIALTVHSGHEFFICLDIDTAIVDGTGLSLAGSRYVLVEFPMRDYSNFIPTALFQIILKGSIPIIAHPERYSYVIDNPNVVIDWIQKGCLIQMNLPSISGLYGDRISKTAGILLKHNMVHFLATDAHTTSRRSPAVSEALAKASEILSAKEIEELTIYNPGHILQDQVINIREPKLYKPKKWFSFR